MAYMLFLYNTIIQKTCTFTKNTNITLIGWHFCECHILVKWRSSISHNSVLYIVSFIYLLLHILWPTHPPFPPPFRGRSEYYNIESRWSLCVFNVCHRVYILFLVDIYDISFNILNSNMYRSRRLQYTYVSLEINFKEEV